MTIAILAATLAALAPLPDTEKLQVQMGIAWLIPAAAALLGAGGSLLKKKGEQKKSKVAAQEQDKANRAQFANSEKDRLAKANSLQRNLSARGLDIQFDPETFTPREYAAPNNERVAGAGNTLGLFGDIAGGAGALLSGYNQSKQREGILSPGQPVGSNARSVPAGLGDSLDIEGLYEYGASQGISSAEMDQLVEELLADQNGATRATQATR